MYQQLLKLSGDKIAKNENYFILDSDTVLVSENNFMEDGKFVFLQNKEWHQPYFDSFEKIFGYRTKNKLSFTSHMMIFNKVMLQEMKGEMEKKWRKPWDQVYLSTVNENEMSCVSDYDTYANWVLCNYSEKVIQRPFYNKSIKRENFADLKELERIYGNKYKSISFHSYLK
ncbi:MAG: hypothetical protein ACD_7C00198G0001 [uncultured bacterium]|nr:MAG: hypothetical protein ACD_7C00198G0001 [uncultured bacterium]